MSYPTDSTALAIECHPHAPTRELCCTHNLNFHQHPTQARINRISASLHPCSEMQPTLYVPEDGLTQVVASNGVSGRYLRGFEDQQSYEYDHTSPRNEGPMILEDGSLSCAPGQSHMAHTLIKRTLPTQHTLLNLEAPCARNAAELRALLGNTNAKLKSGARIDTAVTQRTPPGPKKIRKDRMNPDQSITLEQAKSRARVEVDIILERNAIVQGTTLRGHALIHVRRRRSKKESPVLLADGKLRVIGFETIPHHDSHTFYHYAAPFSKVTQNSQDLYCSPPDDDGYSEAVEGRHTLPFSVELPQDGSSGTAKGPLNLSSGIVIRYIAMISVKVKDSISGRRSVAHFYRDCEVWPRLDILSILAPALEPIEDSTEQSLSVLGGGNGKVKLAACLTRLNWVAGQNCPVQILVNNGTKKTVRSLTLTLIRTTTIFKPRPSLEIESEDLVDPDGCHISTVDKRITDSILEIGQRGSRGHASAKGWWTGITPGQDLSFSHSILLPSNALSISRGRLLEVEYSIRVTISAGSLSSDAFVILPLRIINFASIDPLVHTVPKFVINPSIPSRSEEETASSQEPAPKTDSRGQINTIPSLEQEQCNAPSSLTSINERPDPATHRSLRITNPDPPIVDKGGPLPQSESDASVYSTETSDGHESDDTEDSDSASISRALERRLGNIDVSPDDLGDSDVEVEYAIGTARINRDGWTDGADFNSSDSISSSFYGDGESILSDAGLPIVTQRSYPGEGVGLTSFALRVQEKLIACDRMSSIGGAVQCGEDTIPEEEATPRLTFRPPVISVMDDTLSETSRVALSMANKLSRVSGTVKGPRTSRRLPIPPPVSIGPSCSTLSVMSSCGSDSVRSGMSSIVTAMPARSRTAPGHSVPCHPSLETMRRGQSTGSASSEGVKGRVAAFEERLRVAHENGAAFV